MLDLLLILATVLPIGGYASRTDAFTVEPGRPDRYTPQYHAGVHFRFGTAWVCVDYIERATFAGWQPGPQPIVELRVP